MYDSVLKGAECLVFRYCSESCRDLDWKEAKSCHRQQCIHSLTPEQSAAIVIQRLTRTNPHARQLANIILSRMMTGFEASDFGSNLPTVHSARMVLYDPQTFRTPSRFRTTKNMVVMFLSDGGFKCRFKLKDTGWKTPGVNEIMLLYEEVDFWIAPHRASARTEPSPTLGDGTAVGTQMFLMVEYVYMDFPMAEKRRLQRRLSLSAEYGQELCVKMLLEQGAEVDSKYSHGWTPLSRAASNGHAAVVKMLLEKGAEVNLKDSSGSTPLSRAASNGHAGVVKLLLEKGAEVDSKNSDGQTALSRATSNGHEAVAKLLLERPLRPIFPRPHKPGYTEYKPENPPPEAEKPAHVHCDHIVLLDNNITLKSDIEKLTNYIKEIEVVMDTAVPKTVAQSAEGGGQLNIEADIGGPDRWDVLGRQWFKIRFSPPALKTLPMAEIYGKLAALKTPNIEPRSRFQLVFNVWGFKGEYT